MISAAFEYHRPQVVADAIRLLSDHGDEARLAGQIVGFVQALRKEELEKVPGVAETLDFAAALAGLGVNDLTGDPVALQAALVTLLKTQGDRAAVPMEVADGQPRLISVAPEDVLADQGVKPGEEREGVRYARSMCPSRGTMDIFVEPVLPKPELVVCGSSPVAVALADLGPRFDFAVLAAAPVAEHGAFAGTLVQEGYALSPASTPRYIVIATQGRGDEAALRGTLAEGATYTAFVGSRRKWAALRERLADVPGERLDAVRAPAGLDLGAITPAEIALSILAEMLQHRRRGQRG